jgi:hypothetical protein
VLCLPGKSGHIRARIIIFSVFLANEYTKWRTLNAAPSILIFGGLGSLFKKPTPIALIKLNVSLNLGLELLRNLAVSTFRGYFAAENFPLR